MQNGELFRNVQRILEGKDEIPQRVQNTLLMAAVMQVYGAIGEVNKRIDGHDSRLITIETARQVEQVYEERNITWPAIKDNILMPIVRTIIVLALGYIFFKVTGVAP